MKSDELRSLLLNNNLMEAPDWNEIKEAHDAKPIDIVNGQPVLFVR